MSEDVHKKSERLIRTARVEGISTTDRDWLDQHLEVCAACTEYARATEHALRALRSVSVQVDPQLISATRLRVHLRVRELRLPQVSMLPLWISCALSWVLGVVSAPLVWRGFAWVGHRVGVSDFMWQTGFVLWWTLPAAAAVAVVAVQRRQSAAQSEDSATRPR